MTAAPGAAALTKLLRHPALWQGRDAGTTAPVLDSQCAELNAALGGGWPMGALCELLVPHPGVGEVELLLPALAQLTVAGRWLAWIATPYPVAAPTLLSAGIDLSRTLVIQTRNDTDTLWAMEQCLRSEVCGAVLGWLQDTGPRPSHSWRRLQLAAETGRACGVLFPHYGHYGNAPAKGVNGSPAALRLQITADTEGATLVEVLKRRNGWGKAHVRLPRSPDPAGQMPCPLDPVSQIPRKSSPCGVL